MPETVQLAGELPEPSHWPLSMSRFGVSPTGSNLFRIVFAPSVKMLVGGEFADGFTGYRPRPAYRHLGAVWIIEKWISGFDATQMDEETYNLRFKDPYTGLCITGPYPQRGTYFYCETFNGSPGNANIEKLVSWINASKVADLQKNQQAILAAHAKREADAATERYDRIKELMPAYGIRAANLGGHVKATKTAPILKSANELGLPLRGVTQIKEQHLGNL